MSTTTEVSSNPIVVGDGVVTIIPFQFNWTELDPKIDIVVTTIDTTTEVKTVLTEGIDYDIVVVSIPLSITEPSIVLEDPLPVGTNLLIERKITNIQDLNYDPYAPFPASTHERLVDRIFMSLSEIKNKLLKVPQFDQFVTGITNAVFPPPVDGSFLVWSGNDGTLVNSEQTVEEIIAPALVAFEAYADAGDVATLSAANSYADASEADAISAANTYTDGQISFLSSSVTTALSGKSDVGHTHPLSELQQSGATLNQVPQWNGTTWVPANSGGGVSLTANPAETVGTTNAVGVGTTAAREDHVHAHGSQTTPTDHAVVTGAANGFMSASDKTKLDGVSTGANFYVHPNHSGDVVSSGDGAQTIQPNVVDNTKAADMAANTVKVRAAGTSGDPSDLALSASQLLGRGATGNVAPIVLGTNLSMSGATLNATGGGATNLTYDAPTREVRSDTGTDAVLPLMSNTLAGLVPASGGGTANFLRADGTFAAPPGGGSGLTQPEVLARLTFRI